ncbi:MAG TPA: signal recognition particle-docking protein FtsY [Alphaproteobacteria bacterium]|nr:signal recognition particle-docking protein FtsY [Alphaproteobacteria bacterium]HNS44740.1 signal recognition particle-docking protein FtsY [Alphaproteobacteria bacterium]
MLFWRKKTTQNARQEREEAEDRIVHNPDDPAIEPPVEYDAAIDPEFEKHELNETENEVIDELEEIPYSKAEAPKKSSEDMGGGWLSRLTGGLSKSTHKIGGGLGDLFSKRRPDEATLSGLEDLLIAADLGPATAARLVEVVRERKFDKENCAAEVQEALAEEVASILRQNERKLDLEKTVIGPRTMLICGVNGVGKTTTIGKLAYQFHYKLHKKVMMAAGDTFRAAAIEQLQIWADRTKCPLVSSEIGADSAALAFTAYEKAVADGMDVLMIDTAGRLHNKANLMAELEKISRVLKKKDETLPHEVILILDATTGQNAVSQVETFSQIVPLSGLVVTKLDGSAKGGVVVSLADRFGLPIYAVGVGEDIEDLQPFHPDEFARTLVGLPV